MANPLLELLGFAGNVLDTPGAMVRNTLIGRSPIEGLFEPEKRATGRDLLEAMGVLESNTPGFDAGDVAGFGAEMLLDPLNLIGAGLLKGTLRGAKQAKSANRASEAMRKMGAMPEELAEATRINAPVFHGSPTPGLSSRNLMAGTGETSGNLGHYGKGVYFATDSDQASMFRNAFRDAEDGGSLVAARVMSKNPYITQADEPWKFINELENMTGAKLVPRDIRAAEELYGARGAPFYDKATRDFYKQTAPDIATGVLKDMGHDAVRTGFGRGADEVVVFDPSQIFSTQIAPAMQQVPSVRNPLLALLGHNALKAGRN